ncbi:G-D-S-L family lipolytic protein [Streptomyces sp. SID13031]|nr:G-D-S-L family lipolytic protein [Streptomyces sp. SID13031]
MVLEGQWGYQPGLAITVNSGSRISFTFNGTAAQALFDVGGLETPPHLWVSVDEAEPELHVVDQPVIELTAEKAGPHKVEIVVKDVNEHVNRWNPPFGCAVVFAGLVLDSGTRLRLSGRPSGPRLEFYGDSITQGVRALSAHLESEGVDGSKSYAYLTARALGASAYQVGFGSQGIIKAGNGEVPPGTESFGWNFAGSPAERVEQPDVVVLNLGVNDETLSAAQYGGYLSLVRAQYEAAEIVALSPFNGKHASEIEAAVKAVTAAGDPKIRYVGTDGWITEADCTDAVHPSVDGHAKIAAHLTEELSKLLPSRK